LLNSKGKGFIGGDEAIEVLANKLGNPTNYIVAAISDAKIVEPEASIIFKALEIRKTSESWIKSFHDRRFIQPTCSSVSKQYQNFNELLTEVNDGYDVVGSLHKGDEGW